MTGERMGVRCSDNNHTDGLCSPLGSRLNRNREPLKTRATSPTVDGIKRMLFLEEQICSLLLRHTTEFDINCTAAPREELCDSHKIDTVLVFVEFSRLRQVFFVLLRDRAAWILHLINPKDGRPSLRTVILSWIERSHRNSLAV